MIIGLVLLSDSLGPLRLEISVGVWISLVSELLPSSSKYSKIFDFFLSLQVSHYSLDIEGESGFCLKKKSSWQ